MGLVEILSMGEGMTTTEGKREYAIAGSWTEFRRWQAEHPGREVHYLTKDRAEEYLKWGMPRGVLHRVGTWETSPARKAAERLEGSSG